MKYLVITIVLWLLSQFASAQWDEKFYHPDTVWTEIGLPGTEEISFMADADTVYSFLIKPQDGKKIEATVIYLHGNGSNASKWTEHINPLLESGCQVVIMDYRGYGKSTGKPTHINIAEDAQLLFDLLMEREDVKHLPVIIYGASIGSQSAAHLARNNNSRVSALILDGAMASFTDVAVATSPAEYHEVIKKYVVSPYSAREDVKLLKDISLLIIHSETDAIPISGARELYDSATCRKDFWLYEGEHVMAAVRYPEKLKEWTRKILGKL